MPWGQTPQLICKTICQNNNPLHPITNKSFTSNRWTKSRPQKYLSHCEYDMLSTLTQQQSRRINRFLLAKDNSDMRHWPTTQEALSTNHHLRLMCIARKIKHRLRKAPVGSVLRSAAILDLGKNRFCKKLPVSRSMIVWRCLLGQWVSDSHQWLWIQAVLQATGALSWLSLVTLCR